jgi:hypothetical protein
MKKIACLAKILLLRGYVRRHAIFASPLRLAAKAPRSALGAVRPKRIAGLVSRPHDVELLIGLHETAPSALAFLFLALNF